MPLLCVLIFLWQLELSFHAKVPKDDFKTIFSMLKDAEEDIYDDSGYGWDDTDKKEELKEKGGRFVIGKVRGEIRAFAHFRFSRAGECVYQVRGSKSLSDELRRRVFNT